MKQERETIEKVILAMTAERGAEKSVCPSEVARKLKPEGWRGLMEDVRQVAAGLQEEGKIRVMQGGEDVDLEAAKGPIRLACL